MGGDGGYEQADPRPGGPANVTSDRQRHEQQRQVPVSSAGPRVSIAVLVAPRVSGTIRTAATRPMMPTGTLMRKTGRQP